MVLGQKWRYKNPTDRAICWRDIFWEPGEERETPNPVPSFTGLECIQEGVPPDPVLFHGDLIIQPGETKQIEMEGARHARQVALSLFCMGGGGVECRFISETNRPIPLDTRGFAHVMPWEMCCRLFFKNASDKEAHISVSAVEVIF